MALLFSSKSDDVDRWRDMLARELPDLDFRQWTPALDDIGDPAEIEYVLAWGPRPGAFKDLPNLKCIFSLGAGVDHLIGRDLPAGVPVVRLMDPGLTRGMSEYVLYWVLHHHRRFGDYAQGAKEHCWQQYPQADTRTRRIGIMGLGVLGLDAAQKLAALEFDVAGWSRTPKTLDGITPFDGEAGLKDFLARTEILVCLLPLTPETAGIINSETLGQLPDGAVVINAARGGHVVDDDMIKAIDDGPVSAAVLDVFHSEPLPADHPFWSHPKITVTPHVASLTVPETAALVVVENIRRIRNGQPPEPIVDPDSGY
ncbi:MAG: glyoxylate/hydroxypyruvate reductase A [Alphaproteobacteria bacterium]|nr:glyoxylate/hydroxypyruvate reductase A [Alphaproteobacteria bacterium]